MTQKQKEFKTFLLSKMREVRHTPTSISKELAFTTTTWYDKLSGNRPFSIKEYFILKRELKLSNMEFMKYFGGIENER